MADFVDGPGQHALRVLDEGGKLSGEDAGKLAIFVAALYVRTPAILEQHRQLAEQMRDSLIRGGVEPAVEPLAASDAEAQRLRAAGGVRADELLAMFNAMRDERRPYHNDFVQMMVNLVPLLADAIHGLEWFIASAPSGKAFVTCDAPVIITRPMNHSHLLGVGLTTPGAEKIISIARHPRIRRRFLTIETSRGERCRFGARPNRPASQCLLQSSATLVRIAADSGFIRAVEAGRPPPGAENGRDGNPREGPHPSYRQTKEGESQ